MELYNLIGLSRKHQGERYFCKNITNSYALLLINEYYYHLLIQMCLQEVVVTISTSYKNKLSLDKEIKVVY